MPNMGSNLLKSKKTVVLQRNGRAIASYGLQNPIEKYYKEYKLGPPAAQAESSSQTKTYEATSSTEKPKKLLLAPILEKHSSTTKQESNSDTLESLYSQTYRNKRQPYHKSQKILKANKQILQELKTRNMEYAFNENFKERKPITESPHELINHYVTTKMSLYLNRALLKNRET